MPIRHARLTSWAAREQNILFHILKSTVYLSSYWTYVFLYMCKKKALDLSWAWYINGGRNSKSCRKNIYLFWTVTSLGQLFVSSQRPHISLIGQHCWFNGVLDWPSWAPPICGNVSDRSKTIGRTGVKLGSYLQGCQRMTCNNLRLPPNWKKTKVCMCFFSPCCWKGEGG